MSAIKVYPHVSICVPADEASHNLTAPNKAMFIIIYSDIYKFLTPACFQEDQFLRS